MILSNKIVSQVGETLQGQVFWSIHPAKLVLENDIWGEFYKNITPKNL